MADQTPEGAAALAHDVAGTEFSNGKTGDMLTRCTCRELFPHRAAWAEHLAAKVIAADRAKWGNRG